jgi:cyclic pyranopterin monophosphate synthase
VANPGKTMSDLTHLDAQGLARMVDVGDKPVTAREAVAQGRVRMTAETLQKAVAGDSRKGSVRAVAEIAGIMAAKRTAELIPLCHPISLTSIKVEIVADTQASALVVTARAKTSGQTGVEMEALTAVSVACLTIYDMLKAAERTMVIEAITLLEKHGGASGSYVREEGRD